METKIVWYHRTWVAVLASFLVAGAGSWVAGRKLKGWNFFWASIIAGYVDAGSVRVSVTLISCVVAMSMVEGWHDAEVRNGTWDRKQS